MINKDIKYFLKHLNWKLLLIIIFTILIPVIYQTTRIYFIGQIDDGYNYSIAAQIQWLNVLYEIITEAIIVPIFYTIATLKKNLFQNKITNEIKQNYTLLTFIVFGVFLLFTIIIFFNISYLVNSIGIEDSNIIHSSIEYMRFETWSIFLTSCASFFIVSFSIFRLKWYEYVGIAVNIAYLVVNVLLDLFIVSDNSFSLKLNWVGLGISSIVSSGIYLLICLVYFTLKGNRIFTIDWKLKYFQTKLYIIPYFRNFLFAAMETTIRNVVFLLMVIKMVSMVGEQGTYWVANNFIWTWLLLPISIISLFIKETHSSHIIFKNNLEKDKRYKRRFYLILTSIVVILWLCFLPINPMFINKVMGVSDYNAVNNLVLILFGFYICYAYSSIIDSIFISNGKIGLFLIQTLVVNVTVYPIYFILYKLNIWTPTLNSIAIMFGIGLLIHLIVDVLIFYIVNKYYYQLLIWKLSILNHFNKNKISKLIFNKNKNLLVQRNN